MYFRYRKTKLLTITTKQKLSTNIYPQRLPPPCPLETSLKLILTKIDLSVLVSDRINAIKRATTSKTKSLDFAPLV